MNGNDFDNPNFMVGAPRQWFITLKKRLLIVRRLLGLAAGLLLAVPAVAGPVLLISVDGLRPADVIDAEKRGIAVPTLKAMMAKGAYADGVVGVLPTLTYPSHTTLITGRRAGAAQGGQQPDVRPAQHQSDRVVLVCRGYRHADLVERGARGGTEDRQHPLAGQRRRAGRLESSADLADGA